MRVVSVMQSTAKEKKKVAKYPLLNLRSPYH